MAQVSLTPDQVKKIAGAIRDREREMLGQSLANTTALNAIVQALGLGPDYRTWKAITEKVPAGKMPAGNGSAGNVPGAAPCATQILVVLAAEGDGDDYAQFGDGANGRFALETASTDFHDGSRLDVGVPENGFEMAIITLPASGDRAADLAEAEARAAGLERELRALDPEFYSFFPEDIRAVFVVQEAAGDPRLVVNFRYHDNGQVCSARISEAFWKARKATGLSDEAFLLLFREEVEIFDHVREDDISVEDVMTSVDFYQED